MKKVLHSPVFKLNRFGLLAELSDTTGLKENDKGVWFCCCWGGVFWNDITLLVPLKKDFPLPNPPRAEFGWMLTWGGVIFSKPLFSLLLSDL